MYFCSRERGPMGGGSCFGVSDPTELRPEFPTSRGSRELTQRDFPREEVYESGVVIGSIQKKASGKFIARIHYELLPGEYDDRESAISAVREEAAEPPF